MSILRKTLIATTALTLGSTAAFAGDNNAAFLDQSGADNTALITQSGDDNRAGSTQQSGDHYLRQNGDNNEIDILQSGNRNQVGADRRAADLAGNRGLDQVGDRNVASITQESGGNFVNVVNQNGASGATETTNSVSITQSGTGGYDSTSTGSAQIRYGNVVSVINQTNTGAGTSASEANTITIVQDRTTSGGPGGFGANLVGDGGVGGNIADRGARDRGGVIQNGTGNTATLTQLGERNAIVEVNQQGADNLSTISQNGERNYVGVVTQIDTGGLGNNVSIDITGDRNGSQGNFFSAGAFTAGSAPAMVSNVIVGDAFQSGTDNYVGLIINGNDNLFGFYQNGNGNQATGIDLQGDRNEIAVSQSGDGNLLNLATIANNDNIIGVDQLGNGNIASLSINGDRNGGYNGYTLLSDAGSLNLAPGLFAQTGDNNSATHSVLGDDNVFGFDQWGNNNQIMGSQSGNMNQVAVLQVGNTNNAVFSQVGAGNNAGISQ